MDKELSLYDLPYDYDMNRSIQCLFPTCSRNMIVEMGNIYHQYTYEFEIKGIDQFKNIGNIDYYMIKELVANKEIKLLNRREDKLFSDNCYCFNCQNQKTK